jgi:hypothetical protein
MKWPAVMEEFETMRQLIRKGYSLSRYGDGEFKVAAGGDCVSQKADNELARRLREVLRTPVKGLMVGIPRLAGRDAKGYKSKKLYDYWCRLSANQTYIEMLSSDMRYGSSFITRADNAAHIDCYDYWRMAKRLWRDCDVTVVSAEHEQRKIVEVVAEARSVDMIAAPRKSAWNKYDELMEVLKRKDKNTTFYLACGCTATVMAHDLHVAGYRALDMGALNRFFQVKVITEDVCR